MLLIVIYGWYIHGIYRYTNVYPLVYIYQHIPRYLFVSAVDCSGPWVIPYQLLSPPELLMWLVQLLLFAHANTSKMSIIDAESWVCLLAKMSSVKQSWICLPINACWFSDKGTHKVQNFSSVLGMIQILRLYVHIGKYS